MSKHYEGVKHEPKGNDRPGIALPAGGKLREGERLPMKYEGTEIGYAIILEGGRTASITITSEKHGAVSPVDIADLHINKAGRIIDPEVINKEQA